VFLAHEQDPYPPQETAGLLARLDPPNSKTKVHVQR